MLGALELMPLHGQGCSLTCLYKGAGNSDLCSNVRPAKHQQIALGHIANVRPQPLPESAPVHAASGSMHTSCLAATVSFVLSSSQLCVFLCCIGKLAHCQGAEAAYPCPYIRLSFANASEIQVEDGMRRLGELLRKHQQTTSPQADSASSNTNSF